MSLLTIAVFRYTNSVNLTKGIFWRRSRPTIDFILGADFFLRTNGFTFFGTFLYTGLASYDKVFMSNGKDEKSSNKMDSHIDKRSNSNLK